MVLGFRRLALLAAVALGSPGCAATPIEVQREGRGAPAVEQVMASTRAFLERYASNDVAGVEAMLDSRGFVVYGSDGAEYVTSPAELRQLMADDFKLWHTARFGEPTRVSVRATDSLASVFFEVPFSAGGRPEVRVRMTMVWRAEAGRWRLTQCSNTVPSVGSSARELVSAPR